MKPKTLTYFPKSVIIDEIREVIDNLYRICEPDKQITVKELKKSAIDMLEYLICQIEEDGEYTGAKPEIADDTPYERIGVMWNDICTSYPQIKGLSDTRRKHIKARFKELPNLEEWGNLFRQIQKSEWLRTSSWFDFNWFIKSAGNFEKLREGKYFERTNGTAKSAKINRLKNPAG